MYINTLCLNLMQRCPVARLAGEPHPHKPPVPWIYKNCVGEKLVKQIATGITNGPRALIATPGLAPWSMTVSGNRVKNVVRRGQGGLPPHDASPFG